MSMFRSFSSRIASLDNSYPILPIGMVNMLTGANKDFGTVFNCWEEDPNDTYLLVSSVKHDWSTGKDKIMFKAVITSNDMNATKLYHPVGSQMYLYHDQTGAQFGDSRWTVEGLFSNTKAGLKSMAEKCERKSISFATFK